VLQHVPWSQGGLDPATGLGCYGLVALAFAQVGISLPPTAEEGQDCFTMIPPPYQPFDVALMRFASPLTARHVGVLLTPTTGYQCSWLTNGVSQFCIHENIWKRTFRHGLRYKEFLG
jgi:cell wall-associated NlpC family hydrolase